MLDRLVVPLQMVRPGNVAMGVVGVWAGALAARGLDLDPATTALTALAAALGMAGGNTLNDALDAPVDLRAHPNRPIPRGLISPQAAGRASAIWFGLALVAAVAVNLAVAALAAYLTLHLLLYETTFKRRGLPGNAWVSLVVGTTFVLGALAARGPLLLSTGFSMPALPDQDDLVAVLAMAALAFLANTAREIFKDMEDIEADRGHRRTLPMVVGEGRATAVARMILLVAILGAPGAYALGTFPSVYLALVVPALVAFLASMHAKDPARASWLAKMGMVLALPAFLSRGLL